eukprot:g18853.t1
MANSEPRQNQRSFNTRLAKREQMENSAPRGLHPYIQNGPVWVPAYFPSRSLFSEESEPAAASDAEAVVTDVATTAEKDGGKPTDTTGGTSGSTLSGRKSTSGQAQTNQETGSSNDRGRASAEHNDAETARLVVDIIVAAATKAVSDFLPTSNSEAAPPKGECKRSDGLPRARDDNVAAAAVEPEATHTDMAAAAVCESSRGEVMIPDDGGPSCKGRPRRLRKGKYGSRRTNEHPVKDPWSNRSWIKRLRKEDQVRGVTPQPQKPDVERKPTTKRRTVQDVRAQRRRDEERTFERWTEQEALLKINEEMRRRGWLAAGDDEAAQWCERELEMINLCNPAAAHVHSTGVLVPGAAAEDPEKLFYLRVAFGDLAEFEADAELLLHKQVKVSVATVEDPSTAAADDAPPPEATHEDVCSSTDAAAGADQVAAAVPSDVVRVQTVPHEEPTHCGVAALKTLTALDNDGEGARVEDATCQVIQDEEVRRRILQKGAMTLGEVSAVLRHVGICARAVRVHRWTAEKGAAEIQTCEVRQQKLVGTKRGPPSAAVAYGGGHIEVIDDKDILVQYPAVCRAEATQTPDDGDSQTISRELRGKARGAKLKMNKDTLKEFLRQALRSEKEQKVPAFLQTSSGSLRFLLRSSLCSFSLATVLRTWSQEKRLNKEQLGNLVVVRSWEKQHVREEWTIPPAGPAAAVVEPNATTTTTADDPALGAAADILPSTTRNSDPVNTSAAPAEISANDCGFDSSDSDSDRVMPPPTTAAPVATAAAAVNPAIPRDDSDSDCVMLPPPTAAPVATAAAGGLKRASAAATDESSKLSAPAIAKVTATAKRSVAEGSSAATATAEVRASSPLPNADVDAAEKATVGATAGAGAATTSTARQEGVHKAESPRRIRQRGVEGCEAIAVCRGLQITRSKATSLACAIEEELGFPKGDVRRFSPPPSSADLRLGFRLGVEAKAFETEYNHGTMQMPPAPPLLFQIAGSERQRRTTGQKWVTGVWKLRGGSGPCGNHKQFFFLIGREAEQSAIGGVVDFDYSSEEGELIPQRKNAGSGEPISKEAVLAEHDDQLPLEEHEKHGEHVGEHEEHEEHNNEPQPAVARKIHPKSTASIEVWCLPNGKEDKALTKMSLQVNEAASSFTAKRLIEKKKCLGEVWSVAVFAITWTPTEEEKLPGSTKTTVSERTKKLVEKAQVAGLHQLLKMPLAKVTSAYVCGSSLWGRRPIFWGEDSLRRIKEARITRPAGASAADIQLRIFLGRDAAADEAAANIRAAVEKVFGTARAQVIFRSAKERTKWRSMFPANTALRKLPAQLSAQKDPSKFTEYLSSSEPVVGLAAPASATLTYLRWVQGQQLFDSRHTRKDLVVVKAGRKPDSEPKARSLAAELGLIYLDTAEVQIRGISHFAPESFQLPDGTQFALAMKQEEVEAIQRRAAAHSEKCSEQCRMGIFGRRAAACHQKDQSAKATDGTQQALPPKSEREQRKIRHMSAPVTIKIFGDPGVPEVLLAALQQGTKNKAVIPEEEAAPAEIHPKGVVLPDIAARCRDWTTWAGSALAQAVKDAKTKKRKCATTTVSGTCYKDGLQAALGAALRQCPGWEAEEIVTGLKSERLITITTSSLLNAVRASISPAIVVVRYDTAHQDEGKKVATMLAKHWDIDSKAICHQADYLWGWHERTAQNPKGIPPDKGMEARFTVTGANVVSIPTEVEPLLQGTSFRVVTPGNAKTSSAAGQTKIALIVPKEVAEIKQKRKETRAELGKQALKAAWEVQRAAQVKRKNDGHESGAAKRNKKEVEMLHEEQMGELLRGKGKEVVIEEDAKSVRSTKAAAKKPKAAATSKTKGAEPTAPSTTSARPEASTDVVGCPVLGASATASNAAAPSTKRAQPYDRPTKAGETQPTARRTDAPKVQPVALRQQEGGGGVGLEEMYPASGGAVAGDASATETDPNSSEVSTWCTTTTTADQPSRRETLSRMMATVTTKGRTLDIRRTAKNGKNIPHLVLTLVADPADFSLFINPGNNDLVKIFRCDDQLKTVAIDCFFTGPRKQWIAKVTRVAAGSPELQTAAAVSAALSNGADRYGWRRRADLNVAAPSSSRRRLWTVDDGDVTCCTKSDQNKADAKQPDPDDAEILQAADDGLADLGLGEIDQYFQYDRATFCVNFNMNGFNANKAKLYSLCSSLQEKAVEAKARTWSALLLVSETKWVHLLKSEETWDAPDEDVTLTTLAATDNRHHAGSALGGGAIFDMRPRSGLRKCPLPKAARAWTIATAAPDQESMILQPAEKTRFFAWVTAAVDGELRRLVVQIYLPQRALAEEDEPAVREQVPEVVQWIRKEKTKAKSVIVAGDINYAYNADSTASLIASIQSSSRHNSTTRRVHVELLRPLLEGLETFPLNEVPTYQGRSTPDFMASGGLCERSAVDILLACWTKDVAEPKVEPVGSAAWCGLFQDHAAIIARIPVAEEERAEEEEKDWKTGDWWKKLWHPEAKTLKQLREEPQWELVRAAVLPCEKPEVVYGRFTEVALLPRNYLPGDDIAVATERWKSPSPENRLAK